MPIHENLANVGTVHGGDDAHPTIKSRDKEDDHNDFGAALAAMLYAPVAAPQPSQSASSATASNANAHSAIAGSCSQPKNSSPIQDISLGAQPGSADAAATLAPQPRSVLRVTAHRL